MPLPSTADAGQRTVALSALETAKALLWNEMLAKKLRKADLARLLGVHQAAGRPPDLHHSSKLDYVEQAASTLGRRLTASCHEKNGEATKGYGVEIGEIYRWGRDLIVLFSLAYGIYGLFTGLPFLGRSRRSDSALTRIGVGCGIAVIWPVFFLAYALYSMCKKK